MQSLRVPSAQDVVRMLRPSVEETAKVLRLYYEEQPPFSYGPARAMAKPVFSGEPSLSAATDKCKTGGNPLGRKANAEVAEYVWKAAQGRSFHCHDLTPRTFSIRKDIGIRVDPLFFFVEDRRVKIFWLQPRRRFAPTIDGLAALAVMVRMSFADEFDDAELELLDLSETEPGKGRVARSYGFAELPLLPEERIQAALERFARAYDTVCEAGVVRPARRPRRPEDRAGRTLFD